MESEKVIPPIIAAAIAGIIGFGAGAILNRPTREKMQAEIEAVQTEADRKLTTANQKARLDAMEISDLKNQFKSIKDENIHLLNSINKLRQAQKTETVKAPINHKVVAPLRQGGVLRYPIFGIYLGEPFGSIGRRLSLSHSNFQYSDDDNPGKIYDVENTNSSLKALRVSSYRNQIFEIWVWFSDTSKANYEVIKNELRRKYKSADRDGVFDSLFGEISFVTKINDVDIRINLNRDTIFEEKIELRYIHLPIFEQVAKERDRIKAAKVSSEL